MSYVYVALTVAFTAYANLIVKWQIGRVGPVPEPLIEKVSFLIKLLFDPWIFSGVIATFLAALAWMAVVSKLELSHAYPFMSLSFVVVIGLSGWLFNEPLTPLKIVGLALIVAGIVVGSQG